MKRGVMPRHIFSTSVTTRVSRDFHTLILVRVMEANPSSVFPPTFTPAPGSACLTEDVGLRLLLCRGGRR